MYVKIFAVCCCLAYNKRDLLSLKLRAMTCNDMNEIETLPTIAISLYLTCFKKLLRYVCVQMYYVYCMPIDYCVVICKAVWLSNCLITFCDFHVQGKIIQFLSVIILNVNTNTKIEHPFGKIFNYIHDNKKKKWARIFIEFFTHIQNKTIFRMKIHVYCK